MNLSTPGRGLFRAQGEKGSEFIANNRYRMVPPLHRASVISFPDLNLITGLPNYRVYQNNPGALDYLVNPENYPDQFANYLKSVLQG